MGSVWQDVKFGLRLLMSQGRFSAVAILILALGVGTPTVVFSVVNATLLRPLPYEQPDRLVAIASIFRSSDRPDTPRRTVALTEIAEWRKASRQVSSMGGFAYTQIAIRVGNQALSPVTALLDPQFLPTLAVPLAMGSHFPADASAERTAIVSHRLWTAAFGSDPGAIGRSFLVDGTPHVLRGVLRPDFQFPRSDASYFQKPVDLLLPPSSVPGFRAESRQWWGIARLAPGTTLTNAEAELQRIAEQLAPREANQGVWLPRLTSLADETARNARQPLIIVLGISVVLLLIAATNLMNLLFARSVARLREMAIRRAIGSSTGRIVRQMLTEGLLLAVLGGAAGMWLAALALRAVVTMSPVHLPVTGRVDIDWRVLAFSFAVCGLASLASSLLPALHVSARSEEAVRGAGMRGGSGSAAARVQRALCVAQIALGVALLASAGLLANSLWRLGSVNPGFQTERIIGFNMSIPGDMPLAERPQFYAQALDAVRTIPGVEDAGLISFLPPELRAGVFMGFAIDGAPPVATDDRPRVVNTLIASGSYFDTLGIRILRGRNLDARDRADGRPVILVNETLARRYFSGTDPIGRRVGTGFDGLKPVREIVGIVADAHDRGLKAEPIPTVYIPFEQFSLPYGAMAVRSSSAVEGIASTIRERIQHINPSVPLADFQTLEERLTESLREPRFYTVIAGACAVMAMLFVTFGLYGLISYSVSRRTAELGLRLAIGAQPQTILTLVLSQGLRLAFAGIVLGLALAFVSTRLLRSLLFEVDAHDPLTFGAAVSVTLLVTLLAVYGPARRASRVDPLVALRYE